MLFTRFGVLDPLSLIRELDNMSVCRPRLIRGERGSFVSYSTEIWQLCSPKITSEIFLSHLSVKMLDYFTYISVCSIRSNYKIDLCTQIESIIFISNLINPSGLLTSSKTGFQTSRLWSDVSACHDLTRLSKTAPKTSQSVVEILPAKERHVSVKATFCRPRLCSIECTPRSSALTKGVVRDRTAE